MIGDFAGKLGGYISRGRDDGEIEEESCQAYL